MGKALCTRMLFLLALKNLLRKNLKLSHTVMKISERYICIDLLKNLFIRG